MKDHDFEIRVVRRPRAWVSARTLRMAAHTAGRVLAWLFRPRGMTWGAAALAAFVVTVGTPHVLYTYRCGGVGTEALRCSECRYFGVQGLQSHLGPNWSCPVFVVLPVDWAQLRETVFGTTREETAR